MNFSAIQTLKTIAYAMIEMESMKIANQQRLAVGEPPAYGESDFIRLAERMSNEVNNISSFI